MVAARRAALIGGVAGLGGVVVALVLMGPIVTPPAPLPWTTAIRETSGPTTLAVGAVADGEYLKRVGATLVGAAGGGGGGGPTVTEAVVASLADNESYILTHPATPMWGADYFDAAVLVTAAGAIAAEKSVTNWGSEVFPVNYGTGISYVRDGANTGHFSADPGLGYRSMCKVTGVSTSSVWIDTINNPDPTVASAFTLTADLGSEALAGIYCLSTNSNDLRLEGQGAYTIGDWHEATVTAIYLPITPIIDTIGGVTIQTTIPALTSGKIALSPDNGVTYYYHDGTDWVACVGGATVAWATEGCPLQATAPWTPEPLQATDSSDISAAEWAAFKALITGTIKVKIALKSTDSAATPQLTQLTLTYDAIDTQLIYPKVADTQGMASGYVAQRLSTTQTMFSVNLGFGGPTLSDWRLRVLQ